MADILGHSTLKTDLVSYWELEEASGERADSYGPNDLTDNATVGQGTGKQGNCADFELSNSEYLSITDGNQTGLDFDDVFSWAGWVNFESGSSKQTFFSKFTGAGNQRSYIFRWRDDTSVLNLLTYTDGSSAGCNVSVGWSPTTDGTTWYHVAVTKSGTSVKFYVNGTQRGTTQTGSSGTVYSASSAPFVLGQYDSSNYFDGLMDEVGAWSKELTGAEVSDLYASGSGLPFIDDTITEITGSGITTDMVSHWKLEEAHGADRLDSNASNDLSPSSGPTQGTGKLDNCVDMESSSSQRLYIDDGDQTGLGITGNISGAAWINLETTSIAQDILTKRSGQSSQLGYAFYLDASNNLSLQISNDGSNTAVGSVSWSPSTSTWYYVAFSFNVTSQKARFYVNGEQQGATQTIAKSVIYDNTAPFQLGARMDGTNSPSNFFDGLMDEVSVWSRQISLSELEVLYNSGDGLRYSDTAASTPDYNALSLCNF